MILFRADIELVSLYILIVWVNSDCESLGSALTSLRYDEILPIFSYVVKTKKALTD